MRPLADARYALRAFGRTPVFALTAILSVAIGVGAVTAIVTLANALLLKPPAGVREPGRVVSVGRTQDGRGFDNMSYPVFLDYRAARSLSGLAALRMEPQDLSLQGPAGGEKVQASTVSANFFDVLGARAALGRTFLPDEDRTPGTGTVVVLSHRFWRERFRGDPSIVGKGIVLNGQPFTVVGVAAEGFQGPFVLAPDLWVPITASALFGMPRDMYTDRRGVWLIAIGRLAPGATLQQAQAELATIAARLKKAYPDVNQEHGVKVMPTSLFPGEMHQMVAGFMALLAVVSTLVLVIASTNVAGMLLARAMQRQRELAVRLALGASRARLVRQLVTESLLLFVAAGAAGLLLARVLLAALLSLVPRLPVQLAFDPRMDWRVFAIALVATVAAGAVAGLVPGWQLSHPALVPALKSEGGTTSRRQRLRGGLLVAQLTFSMLLLVVAGLFARALGSAMRIDPGFRVQDVDMAFLDLKLANYDAEHGVPFFQRLAGEARSLPGVQSVALATMAPLSGGSLGLGELVVDGRKPGPDRDSWEADWNVVSPDFFSTIGIPMLRGRPFTGADRKGSADVAILNETFARALWPGQDAVGRTFRNEGKLITVVGVARDSRYRTLGDGPRNQVYVPLAQRYMSRMSLLVRTAPGALVAGEVRRLVTALDPSLPLLDQRPLDEQLALSLFPQRVAFWVAGSLGVVALLLALLGIYGVVAFSAVQRTREIGVRVALGATPARVVRLVLRQGVMLAAGGVALGALGALALTRLLGSLLFGVPPTDAVAFGGAAVVLGLAALAASWLPARRAASLDPAVALRAE